MSARSAQLSIAGAIALVAVAAAQLVLNGWISMPFNASPLVWLLSLVLASLYVASSADWDRHRAARRARWVLLAAGVMGVILAYRIGLSVGLIVGASFPWPSLPQGIIRGPLLVGATLIQLGVVASLISTTDRAHGDHMKQVVELGLISALVGVLAIAVFN